ncbi:hypothetical protein C5167_033977 [Papaver somniferum]|uniref:Glutaredoxin domain-containing protein n=1 Tax=Papaver somniferum TaxID=3469 RepID=A0A4Y7KEP0_PAPSO|nr:hypothetical protein C5167_033977 [Papaver somniferum]
MGCASSSLLDQDDEFTQIGGSTGIGHHFVSLTSTTYGLLTVDSTKKSTEQNPPTPPRFIGSFLKTSPLSEAKSVRSEPVPEVINSWELMAGLDSESARFSPINNPKPSFSLLDTVAELDSRISRSPRLVLFNKENSNPNHRQFQRDSTCEDTEKYYDADEFEKKCTVNGENRVVIYTTTLRGVRKTFEDCNAVRAVFEGLGIVFTERDISMDRGFREELKELLKGVNSSNKQGNVMPVPPRVFIKGRYIGGYEEFEFKFETISACTWTVQAAEAMEMMLLSLLLQAESGLSLNQEGMIPSVVFAEGEIENVTQFCDKDGGCSEIQTRLMSIEHD